MVLERQLVRCVGSRDMSWDYSEFTSCGVTGVAENARAQVVPGQNLRMNKYREEKRCRAGT